MAYSSPAELADYLNSKVDQTTERYTQYQVGERGENVSAATGVDTYPVGIFMGNETEGFTPVDSTASAYVTSDGVYFSFHNEPGLDKEAAAKQTYEHALEQPKLEAEINEIVDKTSENYFRYHVGSYAKDVSAAIGVDTYTVSVESGNEQAGFEAMLGGTYNYVTVTGVLFLYQRMQGQDPAAIKAAYEKAVAQAE